MSITLLAWPPGLPAAAVCCRRDTYAMRWPCGDQLRPARHRPPPACAARPCVTLTTQSSLCRSQLSGVSCTFSVVYAISVPSGDQAGLKAARHADRRDAPDPFARAPHHEDPPAVAARPERDPLAVRRRRRLVIVRRGVGREVDRVLPARAEQVDVQVARLLAGVEHPLAVRASGWGTARRPGAAEPVGAEAERDRLPRAGLRRPARPAGTTRRPPRRRPAPRQRQPARPAGPDDSP